MKFYKQSFENNENLLLYHIFRVFKSSKFSDTLAGPGLLNTPFIPLRIKLDYPLGNISHFNFPLLIVDKCLLKPMRVHGLVVAKNSPLGIRRLAWSVLSLALKWW